MKISGINKIHHGDATDLLRDNSIFPNKSIDLIVTSPPYADKRKYNKIGPNEYVDWFLPISQQLFRVLKSRGSFILNIKEGVKNFERQDYVYELVLKLKEQGWMWREEYIWYKSTAFPGYWPGRFRDMWERVYHFTKQKDIKFYRNHVKVPIGDWSQKRFINGEVAEYDKKRTLSKSGSGLSRTVDKWKDKKKVDPHNVLEFSSVANNKNHSAVFPESLPAWFIKLLTREGNVVLDPFMGSGTTAIAAKNLDRNYIGIEYYKRFINTAHDRISKECK